VRRVNASDFEAEGLYDPALPDAEQRLALLEYLVGLGATLDDMRAAEVDGRLVALAGSVVLRGSEPRISTRELADRAGMPLETVESVLRAAGLVEVDPDVPLFVAPDVASFEAFGLAAELFGEEVVVQFTRTMGASIARVAEAAVGMFAINVLGPMAEGGATLVERAQKGVEGAVTLRTFPQVFQTILAPHLEAASRRSALAEGADASYRQAQLAVGFVDLVGFTTRSQELSTHELAHSIADFEGTAADIITAHDGHVVKMIGDEAMFVAVDVAAACRTALDLCTFVSAHPVLTELRGGLAFGGLVRSEGDYYGPVVNVAARAVKLAAPGAVVCTTAVRDAVAAPADEGLRFSGAGTHELRGFDEPVELVAVKRS
jgi:adenylate cyclase